MALQFITSPEKDFSAGIDARSAENQIAPGYVQDLVNGDVIEKRVRKRPGYQGYAGNLPVRVLEVTQNNTTNELCFVLDTSISLDTATPNPIVVYGRSSSITSGQGPFTTSGDTCKYYTPVSIPLRAIWTAPSGTLSIPASEHPLETSDALWLTAESSSLTDRSHSLLLPDSTTINTSTYDVDIAYTVYQNTNVFNYFIPLESSAGTVYTANLSHTGSGSETFTITAATHTLSSYQIIPVIQQISGGSAIQVTPDSLAISSIGTVTIELTATTATTFRVLLLSADSANVGSVSIAGNTTNSLTISLTSPWVVSACYEGTTDKTLLIPDSAIYSDSTQEWEISFTNSTSSAITYTVYYAYGQITSNRICVTDTDITVDATDSRPQMTIWGLDWQEMYANQKTSREGWVNHIDSYRRSGERRLVSGIGGNLFSARTFTESGTSYKFAELYPKLSSRTSTAQKIGPLFWDTGDTPARTRGYITSSSSGTNWATVSAVEYDTGNGWTKYTLSLPNLAILDSAGASTTIGSVISVASGLEDYLTVQQMSYSRHNGTYKIKQVTSGVNQVFVWVENSTNSVDYNDSGVAGEAAVFSDQIVMSATSEFIPGDIVESSIFGDTYVPEVLGSSGTTVVVSQIIDILEVPAGTTILGKRTSNLIPMRGDLRDPSSSTTNLVRGDMLSYTGIDRLVRTLHVHADSDRTVSISPVAGTATVTLGSGDTSYLLTGQQVLLINAGVYSGVQTITAVPSTSTFEFETEETTTVAGAILKGHVARIDESLDWEDSSVDANKFTVEERWIPIEAPDDSFNLTPSTYTRHMQADDYESQSFLRSTTVQDTLFTTNSSDVVGKFDGTNFYRAGLPAWQPGVFLTQETTGATIVTSLRTITYSAIDAASGRLTITASFSGAIPEGTKVRLTGSTETYKVREYTTQGANYYVFMDRALDSSVAATGDVGELGVYRYYYRLNAIDANANRIASAVTGYQDHVVELAGNAAILHKLIGMCPFDNYDYDRLEVQIYRTTLNQEGPFYLITTLPMDFDNTQGYLEFRDSFADVDLTAKDETMVALKREELGTNISEPLRAKYITTLGNRLVLGNLRDYPELDIQIVGDANLANSVFNQDSLLFRRDSADAGTTTNMVDRVRYEWISSTTGTASGFTIGTNEFSFTTSSATGAVAGDWIYLTYDTVATTGRILTYSGWWQIETVVGTTVTVNLVGAAAAATYPNRYVIATDPTDVPVLLGVDGNLGMFNGDSFNTFDAMRRMSMAINCTMRMVDTGLVPEFTAWLTARGGNDQVPAGRLQVRSPLASSVVPSVVPTFGGYSLFINDRKRSTGDSVSSSTKLFPSRIIISYDNHPEIFDAPTAFNSEEDSESAIDINSADGQEITGIIPFFGESAFGSSLQSGILVVFKTNSIYLVDLNQKSQGLNAVQRIETEGLGCTAPYSIAVTKKGIMFANDAGMYCLRRDQSIQYIGRFMERKWEESVARDYLSVAQGHHYGLGRAYKLSVPYADNVDTSSGYAENSEVFVYNHTGEDEQRVGAWSRYTNHPATGWANLGSDAFFASTVGRVFSIRNTGTDTDFRDDSEGVEFSVETRSNDFGNSGIRKVFDGVVIHYRSSENTTGTQVSYAMDLSDEYTQTTNVVLNKTTVNTGFTDTVGVRIDSIYHSMSRRRGNFLSLSISNSELDESLEVTGIDYRVAGIEVRGLKEAQDTLST